MSGGKFEFDDGGFYVGEWDNGEAEGHGVCTGPESLGKFEGLWKNGVEVSGIYYWPNSMKYKGQWKSGYRFGYGTEICDSVTYLGEWVSGLKHGSGITLIGKKERPCYAGTWRNGLQDGHGVEIYKNEGFYAGQWKDGCRHGFGIRSSYCDTTLSDGVNAIKKYLTSSHVSLTVRPCSLTGIDTPLNSIKESSSESLNMNKLRKSSSSPAKLYVNKASFEKVNFSNFTGSMDSSNSASQSLDVSVSLSSTTNCNMYKGNWEADMRSGYGICFYQDGSRYLGEWKENKRHGYGLLVTKEGRKTGGKWYNDNLLLVTRRKNIKLPMIKTKLNDKIIDAIRAAERTNNKTRLAIARALSARKISDTALFYADLAEQNAKKARSSRLKFTLHPQFQAQYSCMGCRPADQQRKTLNGKKSQSLQSLNSDSKTNEKHRKKSDLFHPFLSHSYNANMPMLQSVDKGQASESALYAAMDTTINSGVINPFMSKMILMQYKDSQCIRSTTGSVDHIENNEMSVSSGCLPVAMSCTSDKNKYDETDLNPGGRKTSSSLSSPIQMIKRKVFHAKHCALKDSSAAAGIDGGSDRLVKVSGRLLTGDDIHYEYVAVSTNVDGKETLVLHTDHPKPKIIYDYTISERETVNSSTGLYRTMIGEIPKVLNVSKPSGIALLDKGHLHPIEKRDSFDSGAMNEGESKEDVTLTKHSDILTEDETNQSHSAQFASFSYSPSFEIFDGKEKTDSLTSLNNSKNIENQAKKERHKFERSGSNSIKIVPRSSIKQVVINQVSIQNDKLEIPQQKKSERKDLSTLSVDKPCSQSHLKRRPTTSSIESLTKPRFRISNWILRNIWHSKDSNKSMRSLSTDSGYKRSIDDSSPVTENFDNQKNNDSLSFTEIDSRENIDNSLFTETQKTDNIDGSSMSKNEKFENIGENALSNDQEKCLSKKNENPYTTVVSIENNKLRRLRSIEFRQSKKKSLSVSANTFDQNRTIESSSPSVTHRDFTIPSFICSSSILESPVKIGKNAANVADSRDMKDVCSEYVIVGDNEIDDESAIFEKGEKVTQL